MTFLSFFQYLTLNDYVFFLLQGTLAWLVIYALFVRYVKAEIKNGAARFNKRVKRNVEQLESKIWVKYLAWQERRKNKDGKNRTIYVESIVSSHDQVGSVRIVVQRTKEDWEYCALAWTVLSVLMIEANGLYNSPATSDISIAIMVIDIFFITYLCFVSGWFRNKIIGIAVWRNNTPDE